MVGGRTIWFHKKRVACNDVNVNIVLVLFNIEKQVVETVFNSGIDEILSGLSFRERRILEERLGLNGRRAKTLEEVGKEYGVTRERIRQIEKKALEKLRRDKKAKRLNNELRD